jgi:hypothetical protein
MNENDVAYFGELLGMSAEEVKAAAENGGLGEHVKSVGFIRPAEVEKLKENLTKEARNAYHSELVEKAKKGDVDPELYKPIKGATFEMLEKELSREYGVTEFEGVKDLVSKAISKNRTATNDKQIQELAERLDALKAVNENLVKEKEEAVKTARTEYEGRILKREKTDHIKSVPFDFSDVDEKELENLSAQRMQILGDVFDARYQLAFDDDKIIVKDRFGKVQQNQATLEPLPASDVMRKLAHELGMKLKSPESGGQGGKSSSGKGQLQFKDYDDFEAYCRANKISSTSAEGVKLWKERRPKV